MAASGKWMLLQSTVLQIVILFTNYHEASDLCRNMKPQNCSKIECTSSSYSLECPKIQPGDWNSFLRLNVKTQEAKLECFHPEVQYEWLKGISIGNVNSLDIQSCPLPQKPFHSFLDDLNISGITKLRIQNCLTNFSLVDQYFQNLEHITHLLMPMNSLTELPSQMFYNMTNLENLDLHDNSLKLVNDELSTLINLKKLELGANNIRKLIPGTFRNLKNLDFLNLWGNYLQELAKEMFIGLENLASLDVNNNQISILPADVFSSLGNLKFLNLYKNNLTSLPENIFSGTLKLEVVKMHYNSRLSEIPPRLFANLPFLQEINLSKCNLTVLPEDIFWGTSSITNLDMSGNSLETLPQLLFRDTKNLIRLDVSNNLLSFLPGDTFKILKRLQIIHLNNNKMTNIDEELFHGLMEMQQLHMNDNKIKYVHANAFQDMTNLLHLNMAQNNLTLESNFPVSQVASPFSKCTNLITVNLSHNNIRQIFSDWMWVLTNLEHLDLSYNNITQLTAHDLQFLSRKIEVNLQNNNISSINLQLLEIINLQNVETEPTTQISVLISGNELNCDCTIYDILRYQERKMNPIIYKIYSLKVDKLTCKGPPTLAGHAIATLDSQKFTCPWHPSQKCPKECQCAKWLAKKHLVVNCTGAGLQEVPEELLSPQFEKKMPIDLILDNNSLHSLLLKTPLHANITTLSLSHNNISWIDDTVLPTGLKELKLDNNNLTSMNSSLLELIKNRTKITLHSNPWHCDCNSLNFLGFLHSSYNQVEQLDNITCNDGRIFAQLTAEKICPFARTITIISCTTIAVIGIVIGVLAALYFRYQNEVKVWLYAHNMCLWFVTEEELDKNKIYDAFISYSHQDEEFVTSKLLPELENGNPPFKICVHYRDWIVGEFITTQIARSIEDSKRTIVVLSKNFIQSEWGRLEFRAAHKQALTEKRARVIVVIYGELGSLDDLDSELRAYLSTNTYVKWGDPWFWDKIRYALPHKCIPSSKKKHGMDKLELINSTAAMKSTTPPADISINPLEVINNLSNKRCKILNEMNGYTNNGYMNNSVKSM